MQRTPAQQLSAYAAWGLGVAPLAFGLVRALTSSGDYRFLWMALAPTFFVAGLLLTTVGRRRSRKAVRVQSIVIFVTTLILATATAFVFGATALPGVIGVAAIYGALLALSSVLVARSRANT